MAFTVKQLTKAMRLYAVTSDAWLGQRSLAECVAQALKGGATFVQLRSKEASTQQLVALGRDLLPLCRAAGVPFVVNDNVQAAKLLGADGVHVGQSDMACAAAREALGPNAIVGVSVQTVEQARAAQAAGASYLGVGAVIPTPTKPEAADVAPAELRRIAAAVDIPVVAIGGLNANTLEVLEGTGVQGAAVVSAIFAADDITQTTAQLSEEVGRVLGLGPASGPHVLPSVLSIAGSDSSGGAGIQADIKTITARGLFAQTAITSLTAQNTLGVTGVFDVPPAFVEQQIDAVFADIRPLAVKIGMVSSPEIVAAIAAALDRNNAENVVVDPVLMATSGASLAAGGVAEALRSQLFPRAAIITPNLDEAQALCGFAITSAEDAEYAADEMARWFPGAVLIKGGHGLAAPGSTSLNPADDLLRLPNGDLCWLEGERVNNPNTHGTGCTLSSAIACGLALGLPLAKAVRDAKNYLTGALRAQLDLGKGSGPLDHAWELR
ncbi:MAG: bifunctional hydroxymethylpyrimidine kinase/phosphomethylpyrimidine kinase [Coriobacteriia bacterium]|nr:bifunctional hydroxymethylpyrimidine kinase/phosphomethylpyrimidine kinase [Coriobacteriia bacterium]